MPNPNVTFQTLAKMHHDVQLYSCDLIFARIAIRGWAELFGADIGCIALVEAVARSLQAFVFTDTVARVSSRHSSSSACKIVVAAMSGIERKNAVYVRAQSWGIQYSGRLDDCAEHALKVMGNYIQANSADATAMLDSKIKQLVSTTRLAAQRFLHHSEQGWLLLARQMFDIRIEAFRDVEPLIMHLKPRHLVEGEVKRRFVSGSLIVSHIRYHDGSVIESSVGSNGVRIRRLVWGLFPAETLWMCTHDNMRTAVVRFLDIDRPTKLPHDAVTDRLAVFCSLADLKRFIAHCDRLA